MSFNVAQAALPKLREDGTFDDLRKRVEEQVKHDDHVRRLAEDLVLKSKHLPPTDANRKARHAAVEAIRKELEGPILEQLFRACSQLLSEPDSQLQDAIDIEVHAAACKVVEEQEAGQRELQAKYQQLAALHGAQQ